ncbi:hypothetical protein NEMBOFW57_005280 [Staphylotrichum longicolle]|uniref:WW domain-containing protein n=1 Tax=Staphylotrichum longicolle TaxID=669026 RepID=A0AAD4EXF0_9PEZI|nr:hypothetical protein NEMBOFW57_005280 [Staphylotrichum longicolle]
MASLPENWEWDYDGSRWFYRYKPTGLVQYTFPKPGDEFPEFVDFSSSADLAPEEKLVSQQQIKRRSTLGESSKQAGATTRQARATSNAISDPDDGAAPFWLQPDGLMYMGPGAYNDISPLLEEEEDERGGHHGVQADEKDNADGPTPGPTAVAGTATSPDLAKTTPVTVSTVATPNQAVVLPARSHISPVVSVETTPHASNSQPAVATPELDSTAIVEVIQAVPVDVTVVHEPEVPLLDSRQVPYNPIGFVAELASELTARCDDEINPAPVEMPSNEIMMDTSEPLPYANAFHLAPVELASDEAPARRTATRNVVEDKSLASQHPGHERVQEQQQKAYQAVQDLLNRPYKPAAQTSLPQPATTLTQPPNPNPDPAPAKFQPYNPSRNAAFAPDVNRYSTVEPRSHQPIIDNKRHSLAGPALSQQPPSDIPPALQVPQVPPKLPLESASTSGPTAIPGSGARHESISGPAPKGAPGTLAYFPSILQPARGRPVIRAQSPPQSQGASPARTYQAYKPYHDLQRDIEDTVQLLSKTGNILPRFRRQALTFRNP